MTLAAVALAGLTSMVMSRLLAAALETVARARGSLQRNYRGHPVVVGVGVAPVLAAAGSVVIAAAAGWVPERIGSGAAYAALTFGMFGLIDDWWGDRTVRGLKGHLQSAWSGRWTTGALKACGGGATALLTALLVADGWSAILAAAFLIGGGANAANLLDLRPGRAGKGLLLGWLVVAAAGFGAMVPSVLAAAAVGALAAYLPFDLKERAMMGDAGANGQGALWGVAAAVTLLPFGQWVLVGALAWLHLFCERGSLSEAIDRVPLLRRLDAWGRRRS